MEYDNFLEVARDRVPQLLITASRQSSHIPEGEPRTRNVKLLIAYCVRRVEGALRYFEDTIWNGQDFADLRAISAFAGLFNPLNASTWSREKITERINVGVDYTCFKDLKDKLISGIESYQNVAKAYVNSVRASRPAEKPLIRFYSDEIFTFWKSGPGNVLSGWRDAVRIATLFRMSSADPERVFSMYDRMIQANQLQMKEDQVKCRMQLAWRRRRKKRKRTRNESDSEESDDE